MGGILTKRQLAEMILDLLIERKVFIRSSNEDKVKQLMKRSREDLERVYNINKEIK